MPPSMYVVILPMYIKTKTKKPLFYLDNIFNNLLIFNTVQTKNNNNIEWHTIINKTNS